MLSSYGDSGASSLVMIIIMIIIILYDNMHHHHFPLKLYWIKFFKCCQFASGARAPARGLAQRFGPEPIRAAIVLAWSPCLLASGLLHLASSPTMSWTTATKKTLNDLKRQLEPSGLAEVETGIPNRGGKAKVLV